MAFALPSKKQMYLDLVELLKTLSCFLFYYVIVEVPIKKIYSLLSLCILNQAIQSILV